MNLGGTLIWLGILQAVIYLLFIRAIDLYEQEPLRYVIPVSCGGLPWRQGLTGLQHALPGDPQLSDERQDRKLFTAVVEAPVVEECSKGAALLLIFLIAYLARRRSGLVEFAV